MSLSAKSTAILKAISEGHAYDQIIREGLAGAYLEIFQAAAEALQVDESKPLGGAKEARPRHHRAHRCRATHASSQCGPGLVQGTSKGPKNSLRLGHANRPDRPAVGSHTGWCHRSPGEAWIPSPGGPTGKERQSQTNPTKDPNEGCHYWRIHVLLGSELRRGCPE